ncbi:MAG: hypothetical protein K5871_03720 [Lachnospiraceae bacterium]|nr:hypothetical protein [Lachnospiraceae bacterium]
MLEEFKNAYKLVQYGLKIKTQLGLAALFAVIGIVIEVLGQGEVPTGSFYIVLSGMFIYQLIISVDISTLVQSSPYKKKIQCSYPLIATAPWVFLTLTILTVIHAIYVSQSPEKYLVMCRMTMLLGSLLFILMVYFGLAYKYFIASTILMFISVFFPIFIFQNETITGKYFTNFGVCVFLAYLLTTIGTFLCWLICRLTYRKELSKLAFKAALRTK